MLDHHTHRFLLRLEKAGDWVNLDEVYDIPQAIRSAAVQAGYVEARGSNDSRQYRYTKAAGTALAQNAQEALAAIKANGHADADTPEVTIVTRQTRKGRGSPTCSVEGCDEPKHKNGKCHQHYLEAQRVYQARWQEKKRKTARNAATLAAEEPPVTEEDTERDPVITDDAPPPFARGLAMLIIVGLTTYYQLKKGLR